MQGNVVGLIELDPLREGQADSLSTADAATLADTLHRLAHDEGPIAVDTSDDQAATAEILAVLDAPQASGRWSPALGTVTHLTINRAALLRDLSDELRALVDRLISR